MTEADIPDRTLYTGEHAMRLSETVNEYGTPVAVHRCDDCGDIFTVTSLRDDWGGCLSEQCSSYDLDRDVDLFFGAAWEAGWVRRATVVK